MVKCQGLVLDLGGGYCKIGFSHDEQPQIYDNCMLKSKIHGSSFISPEIKKIQNLSKLYLNYPFKKGFINNWDLQKEILDATVNYLLPNRNLELDEIDMVLTEPYFNFSSAKSTMNQIMFEEYSVNSLLTANPAFYSAYTSHKMQGIKNSLIIDSGYSFTHIVGVLNGRISPSHVIRLNIGGKVLTNRLIEMISYRQLDVRSELYIMNKCKEDSCFVSNDFFNDLKRAQTKNFDEEDAIPKDYYLPDFSDVMKGYLTQHKTGKNQNSNVLFLTNERFTVPELLFHPSDVGFPEMGIEEALPFLLNEKIESNMVRYNLLNNVILTGGNCNMPGCAERIENILKSSSPDDFNVNVTAEDPQLNAWKGARLLYKSPDDYNRLSVNRKEYEEYGDSICDKKFPTL